MAKVGFWQNGGKAFAAMVGQGKSQIDYNSLIKGLIAPVQCAGTVIMDIYQTIKRIERTAKLKVIGIKRL